MKINPKKKAVSPLEWDNERVIQEAYMRWCLEVKGLRHEEEKPVEWDKDVSQLQVARAQLQLSSNEIAKKLGVSRFTVINYEKAEMRGAVSVATLEKVAEAMGCEFVYSIRPKGNKTFAQVLWHKIFSSAILHKSVTKKSGVQKTRALVAVATRKLYDSKFRAKMNWSERATLFVAGAQRF